MKLHLALRQNDWQGNKIDSQDQRSPLGLHKTNYISCLTTTETSESDSGKRQNG